MVCQTHHYDGWNVICFHLGSILMQEDKKPGHTVTTVHLFSIILKNIKKQMTNIGGHTKAL
jgi:hypothetical protein